MKQIDVWYDGECPLCIREIALMKRLDKKGAVRFSDLASSDTVCPLDRNLMLERFHAQEGGLMLSGAAAFAAVWRVIPLLRPLGMAARLPGILAVMEFIYRMFLKIRPGLQRLVRKTTKPEQ